MIGGPCENGEGRATSLRCRFKSYSNHLWRRVQVYWKQETPISCRYRFKSYLRRHGRVEQLVARWSVKPVALWHLQVRILSLPLYGLPVHPLIFIYSDYSGSGELPFGKLVWDKVGFICLSDRFNSDISYFL